jgi:hypothetical protein
MNKNLKIVIIVLGLLALIGGITAIIVVVQKNKMKKAESFAPIITISCADCINKCNDKYKNDPRSWTQCSLDSISNPDCKCPDIKTILDTKL